MLYTELHFNTSFNVPDIEPNPHGDPYSQIEMNSLFFYEINVPSLLRTI